MNKGVTFRCGKHRKEAFASKDLAEARLAEVLTQDRIGNKNRKPVRVHYDDGCGFWHLTSERRSRASIRAEEKLAKERGVL